MKGLVLVLVVHLCTAAISHAFVVTDHASCGHQTFPPSETRIVGGHEARIGSWPWMAMLIEDGNQVCGGSILNEYFILTAAHCFEDELSRDTTRWTVRVGKHHLDRLDPTETTHRVSQIIIHPQYNSTTVKNDITLLQLIEPVQYNDYVRPICIPPSARRVANTTSSCYSTGWGDTHDTSSRTVLNQVKLQIIPESWCSHTDWYGSNFIKYYTFCAGYPSGGQDTCTGDSGGPFVCKVDDTWYQQGIISWGHGCALPFYPGIYTDVSKYGQWIRNNIASRGFHLNK
ncbi:hypothetical protein ACJMK2_034652 [Sinanodonta woodiana]|uniref:Peptidase S1 domain-containing protein n=1 Tax=Sinanodonta woodiana TaxID=1069815 RepID=A0ABD3WVQ3_SINWO